MKRLIAGLTLAVAAATLSGCYYDPGYNYVRPTAYSGAYYGSSTVTYGDGYYAPSYGYYGPSYGYGYYGCCYAPGVAIGLGGWYGGHRYYGGHGYYRGGGYYHGGYHGGYSGGYHGGHGGYHGGGVHH